MGGDSLKNKLVVGRIRVKEKRMVDWKIQNVVETVAVRYES